MEFSDNLLESLQLILRVRCGDFSEEDFNGFPKCSSVACFLAPPDPNDNF